MNRIDPIEQHYAPLRQADVAGDWLFWVLSALSIAILLVDADGHPMAAGLLQGAFVVGVVANFALGLLIRLHWAPRAEDRRREELLSNSLGVNLTHERTVGYYNNDVAASVQRLAVALLENSFFSKHVAGRMVVRERLRVGIYFAIWLIALVNRKTDLALIGVIAQVIFSETLVSKLVRLEWLRARFERAYDALFNLLLNSKDPADAGYQACVLKFFGIYETGKAYGGVVMSSKIFFGLNPSLSSEWSKVKAAVGVT